MSGLVQHTGSRSYSVDTSGTYYVLCKDDFDNTMSSSNSISFSADVTESSGGGSNGGGGSGGGGGGGSSGGSGSAIGPCTENWVCDSWNDCILNFQTRKCIDLNACSTSNQKPKEFQTCKTGCEEIWQCDEWSVCSIGLRQRECSDLNKCNTEEIKPSEYENCNYISRCYNLIQDNGESGLDCGGPCQACETCFDRIQNQGEEGIDCGQPCRPCRTGDILTTGKIIQVLPSYTPNLSSLFIIMTIVISILFTIKESHRFKGLNELRKAFHLHHKGKIISLLKDKYKLNKIKSHTKEDYHKDIESLNKHGFTIKPKHIARSSENKKDEILNKLTEVYKHDK